MISRNSLEAEILAQARASAEVKQGLKEFGEQVVEYWRSVSPVRTGRYAASVRVRRSFVVDGFPGVNVGSTSNRAGLIEYGTGSDEKFKNPEWEDRARYAPNRGVQFGPDTPTPAFAPRAKTAAHFGGDEKRVTEVNEAVQEQNVSNALGSPSFSRDNFKAILGKR
jgi:hypothetical protein